MEGAPRHEERNEAGEVYLREEVLKLMEKHTREDMTIDMDAVMEELVERVGGEEVYGEPDPSMPDAARWVPPAEVQR